MSKLSRPALIYGRTSQTLEFYPPHDELVKYGAPDSAPTVTVWRGEQSNDDTAILPSSSGSLDSVATTLSAAAGLAQTNRKSIALTSNASIAVGRRYVMTNTGNQRAVVALATAPSSGAVLADADLGYDFASTNPFEGARMTYAVDDTFAGTLGNINALGVMWEGSTVRRVIGTMAPPYRARWRYILNGVSLESWSYFDLVRQAAKHNVTPQTFRRWWPDVADHEWRGQRGSNYLEQIDLAEEWVAVRLQGIGHHPSQIREGSYYDMLVETAAHVFIAEAGNAPTGRTADAWATERRERWAQLWAEACGSALHMWLDLGTTGAITPDPPKRGKWRR